MGLYSEFISAELRGSVVVWKPGEDMDPYRATGKFSSMGDNEVGSKTDFVGEFWKRSRSGGGVGVRGGKGMGLSSIITSHLSPQKLHVFVSWLKGAIPCA